MDVPEFFGQCFDVTLQTFLAPGSGVTDDGRLCHGIGRSNIPGHEGERIKHAWIEQNGTAYDCVWQVSLDAIQYRNEFKICYAVEYTKADALAFAREFDRSGPWDERIIAECPDLSDEAIENLKRELKAV